MSIELSGHLPNLQHLKLGRCAKLLVPLPNSLRSLQLRDSQGPQRTALPWPPELEELDLGDLDHWGPGHPRPSYLVTNGGSDQRSRLGIHVPSVISFFPHLLGEGCWMLC